MHKHQLHNELKQKQKQNKTKKKKWCKMAVASFPAILPSFPRQLTAEITSVVNCRSPHASLDS